MSSKNDKPSVIATDVAETDKAALPPARGEVEVAGMYELEEGEVAKIMKKAWEARDKVKDKKVKGDTKTAKKKTQK